MKFILVIDEGAVARLHLTLPQAIDKAIEYWAEYGDAPVGVFDESTGVEVTKFRIEGDPRELSFEQLCELSYYKCINLVSCS